MFRIILLCFIFMSTGFAEEQDFIKGFFSVAKGNAYYEIKIDTPKTRGVSKLHLAFLYNSSIINTSKSKDGILGNAFSLIGLSTISKCSQTLVSEKNDKSRNYNYCLDGKKLLVVSGSYGATNSEYRTEINKFVKIIKDTSGWVIETKNGMIFHYGKSSTSKVSDVFYRINKITDRFKGNDIDVSYNSDQTVNEISYLNTKIDFIYESRNDTHNLYGWGSTKIDIRNRLLNIIVKSHNKELYTYNIEYIYKNNRSHISKIIKCYEKECKKGLDLSWNDASYLNNISNDRNENTDITYVDFSDSIYTSTKNETSVKNIQKETKRKLVKSYSILNGVHNNKNKTTFTYKDYFINKERNKRSFEFIVTKHEAYNKRIERSYRQDFPFTGMLLDKKVYDEEVLLEHTTKEYIDGTRISSYKNKIFYPLVAMSKTKFYDFNTQDFIKEQSLINVSHDNNGNITAKEISVSSSSYQVSSKKIIDIYKNVGSSWITKLAERSILHDNGGNKTTQKIKYNYYSTGALKEKIIEPGDSKYELKTYYEYDDHGNIYSKRVSGNDIKTQRLLYRYDSSGNHTTLINSFGHKINKKYDYRNLLEYIIDENRLITSYKYDNFGRKIKETRADKSYIEWRYVSLDNYYIMKYENGVETKVAYDNFNRVIATVKASLNSVHKRIYQEYYYNNLGQNYKESSPHFPTDGISYTTKSYDKIGRVIKIEKPGGNGTNLIFKKSYNKFSLIEINPKGQEKTTVFNYLNQVEKVIDNKKTIYYSYDSLGNLKSADGNYMNYDKRGNKISTSDKNMGKWIYEHNVLGQIKKQTDANGNTINFKYDGGGRLTHKVSNTDIEIEYTYDLSPNGKGKIYKEETSKVVKEYFYTSKGQNYKTKTTIKKENRSFEKKFEFDSYGRVSKVIEPNNFELKYKYKNNYLESISSPRKGVDTIDINTIIKSIKENNSERTEALKHYEDIEFYKKKIEHYNKLIEFSFQSVEILWRPLLKLKKQTKTLERFLKKLEEMTTSLEESSSNINNYKMLRYWLKRNNCSIGKCQDKIDLLKEHLSLYRNEHLKDAKYFHRNDHVHRIVHRLYRNPIKEVENLIKYIETYKELDDPNNIYFYKALEQDAFGRITKYLSGNGLETKKIYDKDSGQLTNITTGFEGGNKIRNLDFNYDSMNNVTYKRNNILDLTANYVYDNINRLTDAYIDTPTQNLNLEYNYDVNGNILYKSDLGVYKYDYSKPYAVKSIVLNSSVKHFQKLKDRKKKLNQNLKSYKYVNLMYNIYFINGFDPIQVIKENSNSEKSFLIKLTKFQRRYSANARQFGFGPRQYFLRNLKNSFRHGGLDGFDENELNRLSYPGDTITNKSKKYARMLKRLVSSMITLNEEMDFYSLSINEIKEFVREKSNEIQKELENINSELENLNTINFTYDANGNMIKKENRTFEYNAYNKVSKITEGNISSSFEYDANGDRYKKSSNGINTYYIDKGYEEIREGNNLKEKKYFIYVNGKLLSIFSDKNSQYSVKYLHYDSLNSVDTITDGFGNVEERFEYKPFGEKLNLDKDGKKIDKLSTTTNRGYTGHEHVEEFDDIIHMNGRVYDSQIARFISADPNIFHPFDTQDFNRYSYVRNNPLRYIDPSGYGFGDNDYEDGDFDDRDDPSGNQNDKQSDDNHGSRSDNDRDRGDRNSSENRIDLGSIDIIYTPHEINDEEPKTGFDRISIGLSKSFGQLWDKKEKIGDDIVRSSIGTSKSIGQLWDKKEKIGGDIVRAYGNSHPAFKSIAVVSIAITSPLAVYSYNVINTSKTTTDFIDGLSGAQPTNRAKTVGQVVRKTIQELSNWI